MFGLVDVIMFCGITFVLTSFVCLFMAGASIQSREREAYQDGYYKGYNKGYEDGKKVGGANDI